MLIINKNLEEEFFMLKFISGLKEEVKSFVSTCNPTSLNQVVVLARKQEHTISAILKKAHQPSRNTRSKPPFRPQQKSPPPRNNPQAKRFLTEVEVRAKKEKNLCYRCDEPYAPGHRCRYKQVYMLLSDEEAQDYDKVVQEGQQVENEEVEEDMAVSLHAMKGSVNYEEVAGALGCEMDNTTPMIIMVADGSKLIKKLICPRLSNYNPVELDFHQFKVTLSQADRTLILRTLPNEPRVKVMSAYSL
ncbi:UNVERIFIED_CONTAM: hypothetical protein Scaly_2662600 [Sesamum calycinum]|uniref:Uncharacterized protein n=1 Tax=Sesamum calycinum TaxID=2727403 RepID=A0AAW2J7J3_9LAMI